MKLPQSLVWVERGAVLLANVGINLGLLSQSQEHTIAAGGIIGGVTLVQVLGGLVTHVGALHAAVAPEVKVLLNDATGAVQDVERGDASDAIARVENAHSELSDAVAALRAAGKGI